jgi:hypothetical protein
MRDMRLPAAIALLFCATAAPAQDSVARFYGYAYHLDSGRYAFTEVLEQRFVAGQWVGGRTTYFLPDGQEFGRKTLDFTGDPFVPVYRLELKESHVEAITDNGNPVAMRREHRGAVMAATVQKSGLTTADAGLPRLLRAHFEPLLRGDTLQFRVIAPTRLAAYQFRAARAADATFEGKPAVRIEVKLDSILNLFAGPLSFTFHPESRKLLEFRGLTNVIDPATDQPFTVRISYFSAPPGDVPVLPALAQTP